MWIKEHRGLKVNDMIEKINVKLRGHYQYYGITDNSYSLNKFKNCCYRLLWKWLNRRSERRSYTMVEFNQLIEQMPLLKPKIYVNIYDRV